MMTDRRAPPAEPAPDDDEASAGARPRYMTAEQVTARLRAVVRDAFAPPYDHPPLPDQGAADPAGPDSAEG